MIFCLISDLNEEPYHARLTLKDLTNQCKEQGFVDDSIKQIQTNLSSQIANASLKLEFKKRESKLDVAFAVSDTINVELQAQISHLDNHTSMLIYRDLLQEIMVGSYSLRRLSDRLENLLHMKDRAIEYLTLNVEEFGTAKVIKRWAPPASSNAKALVKYQYSNECDNLAESLQDEAFNYEKFTDTGEFLFDLQRRVLNSVSTTSSPKKRLRRTSSTDFLPFEDPIGSNKIGTKSPGINDKDSSLKSETELKSKSDSPDLPNKKRKFGKVKIMKRV